MFDRLRMFFGYIPDTREAEGFLSPAHLIFVTVMLLITVLFALRLAEKRRGTDTESRMRPLKAAAVVLLLMEGFRAIILCTRGNGLVELRGILPLFLCSVLILVLPVAAFAKGRAREAALDFSLCFGPLCAVAGTYLAANIFSSPILSFDVLISVLTHCVPGFAAVYIGATGLASMRRENRPITGLILLIIELMALAVDIIQLDTPYQSNYMFFMTPDGTPFSILEAAAGGVRPVYTLLVALIYFAYLVLFELVYALIKKRKQPAQSGGEAGKAH